MIELSELLSPTPSPLWRLVKQCGVDGIVSLLEGAEQDQRMFPSVGAQGTVGPRGDDEPWGEPAIRRHVEAFDSFGLKVVAIEDTPPLDLARLGLPGRDEQIENVITQVRAMGRLGVPTLCYNWMAVTSWSRTEVAATTRGGALVTQFRASDSDNLPPLVESGEVTDDQLWDALRYFLGAVLPAAESAGVRLALHPDDPPRALVRNVPRIMRSADAYRRLLGMDRSPSNAITFCQGNFALMKEDLPALIREFGRDAHIAFVHFRDVRGTADDFTETFHDDGQTDLVECMRAYSEIGFTGPMRPDHVPTMYGESNAQPSYGTLGRLFALGYIRGLAQSAERPTRP